MTNSPGFSVRIFIPEGEPEGVRIIEKSNWTGKGIVFPRSRFAQVRKREEVKRTGVYVLWGPDESSHLPRAYVGQGDSLLSRLVIHFREKDFWTHAVAYISKDHSLNKAHAHYLEARMLKLAQEAKRCELDNEKNSNKPSLSDADEADAELYLADMLLCLQMVGVSFFEKPQEPVREPQELILRGKCIEARGYEGVGEFVVRSGSLTVKEEVDSIPTTLSDLRRTLCKQEILKDIGGQYRFDQDYGFSSPSKSAGVILGRSCNGRTEWQDSEGKTLKQIQQAEADGL